MKEKIKKWMIAFSESIPYLGNFLSSLRSQNDNDKKKENEKIFLDQKNKIKNLNKYSKRIRKVILYLNIENPKKLFENLKTNDNKIIQILVYSYGWKTSAKNLKIKEEKKYGLREYPIFLKEIGFVRVGGSGGNLFFIEKNKLIKKIGSMDKIKSFLDFKFKELRLLELKKLGIEEKNIVNVEKNNQAMPYFYLITENNFSVDSFGAIPENNYVLTETSKKNNNQNDQLMELLFNNVKYNELIKKKENITPKEMIEENFDLNFIVDNCEEFQEKEKKEIKEKYQNKKINILTDENFDDDILKKEILEYKKALKEIGIVIK